MSIEKIPPQQLDMTYYLQFLLNIEDNLSFARIPEADLGSDTGCNSDFPPKA